MVLSNCDERNQYQQPVCHSQCGGDGPDDEAMIDILSRLPLEQLRHCGRVCNHCKSLIQTPYFNNLYVKRGGAVESTLVIQQSTKDKVKLLFVKDDGHGSSSRSTTKLKKIPFKSSVLGRPACKLAFSYHGLLWFEKSDHSHYVILNPVTQEVVTFDLPFGQIVALFFHPKAKEYYVIWIFRSHAYVEFKVLKLDSLLSRDDPEILQTGAGWEKVCDVLHAGPRGSPTWTNDGIYWKAEGCENQIKRCAKCSAYRLTSNCQVSILGFDMNKGKFHEISHPGGMCKRQVYSHDLMHIFETNGHLSFCKFTFDDVVETVDIWDLESNEWSLRNTIRIHNIKTNITKRPIGILDGELIITGADEGVFAVNLHGNHLNPTVRTIACEKYNWNQVSIHSKTLVSLGNYSKTSLLSKLKKTLLQWL